MNKKVLNVMIWLTWGILAFFLIAKLFFGEWVAIIVTNERLVKIGVFIDNHFWLYETLTFVFTLLTYYLYLCACSRKWRLSTKSILCIVPILLILHVVKYFNPTIGMVLDYCTMFVIPYYLGATYKDTAFIFCGHCMSQMASLYIRNIPVNPLMYNSMSMIILMIDQYIWLLIYYFYQNKYKKEN